MLAPPPSTRTDLDDLERIVEAKRPKVVVEELDADFLIEEDDAVDSVGSTRVEAQVYRPAAEPSMPAGVPDPRRIVQQQKEFVRQQELARQAEIARQQEMARQAEIARQQQIAQQQEMARRAEEARQQEIARQQEYARQQELAKQEYERQQELARQAEAARQAEMARQQEVAREFERQEAEIARQKAEVARQQAIVREQQELARQQQEIARQKEELARAQEIARQQDLVRQQALARQAEELARQQELAKKQRESIPAQPVSLPPIERAIVTPRDAEPMSASQMKAATLNAPPMSISPPTPAMPTPKVEAAVDLSATVQGVPAPLIPDAPATSPVLADADEDAKPATKPTAKTLQSAQPNVKITEASSADAEEAKNFTQPFRRPSSIAPVAIDIMPAQSMSPIPPRTNTAQSPIATMPIQRMDARRADSVIAHLPPPKENHTPWIIAACVAGLFLVGGGITAAFALGSSSSSSASAASQPAAASDDDGRPAPRTAEGTGAKLTDPSPSSNDPVSVNSLPTASSPKSGHVSFTAGSAPTGSPSHASATPSSSPTSKVLVPAPAAAPAPSPSPSPAPAPAPSPSVASTGASAPAAPKAAAPQTGTGTIHVAPPLVVIVVDGQHKRAVNGDVVVSCGTHKIRAGMDTQVVNVPCGGAISL